MRIITIILPLLLLAGCEGRYRYPCQDPANWGKTECNNEVCKAEGTCTSDVLAPAGTRELGLNNTPTTSEEESTEVSTESGETEISNSGCTPAQQASLYNDAEEIKQRSFKVKNKMVAPEQSGNEGLDREVIEIIDNSTEEQPVTMKSEVDAVEHDKAVE